MKKPKNTAFKIAAELLCLPNKYRDTLGSLALTAYVGVKTLHGDFGAISSDLFGVWGTRELMRSASWREPSPIVAGGIDKPVDHEKNEYAAGFVSFVLILGCSFGDVLVNPSSAGWSGAAAGLVAVAGATVSCSLLHEKGSGLRDIPKLYFDKQTGMWDWPSRQGGGGLTETKRLWNKAVSAFGQSLAPGAAQLRPEPIRVPADRFRLRR